MAAMENDFENATISLYGTVPDSIVDGPGLRYAVFVQGCSHGCPGCHNPESQPAEGGTETTLAALLADIRANGLVHDVTLSGGEPFEQPKACAALAAELKRNGYGVWSYSGYLYEDLAKRADKARAERDRRIGALGGKALHENPEEAMVSEALADIADDLAVGDLLDSIDVLVDGPFVESRKSLEPTGRRAPFGAMTDKSFRVFGDHFFGNLCHPMGSRTVKRVPTSSSLSTDTSPPW